jgi:hypothetical protein
VPVAQALPDLLRELLTTFVNILMSAEVDAVCYRDRAGGEQVLHIDNPVGAGPSSSRTASAAPSDQHAHGSSGGHAALLTDYLGNKCGTLAGATQHVKR